jgi:hypothetical protein
MSRLNWNAPEGRYFDTGLDRGVLYPKGVPPLGVVAATNLYTRPSFETQAGTIVVETNLAENPSAENAAGWSNNNGTAWTVTRDTSVKRSGTQSVKSVLNAGQTSSSILSLYSIGSLATNGSPATAGTVYSMSAHFMTPHSGYQARVAVQFLDAASAVIGGVIYGSYVALTANVWSRASLFNTTAPTGTTRIRVFGYVDKISGSGVAGDAAYVDDAFIASSWGHGDYFDGGTAAADEFTYAWTGTAHASTSTRSAAGLAGVSGGAASAIYSTDWASSGVASARIYSKYHGAGSGYVDFGTLVSWGKTYTIKMKVRIREALSTAPRITANTIGNTPAYTASAELSSTLPGVYDLSLTFSFPAQSAGGAKYVRFLNNNANGASVWIDDVVLIEGDGTDLDRKETVPYFSGDTEDTAVRTYEWTGNPHESTSIMRYVQTLAVPWLGLQSVDEEGGDSAAAYYIDGRPFLFLPRPKEYKATLKAMTYPDEFSEIMGVHEVADGMYLDSQPGESFDLSYRTLVGNAIDGVDHGYKIHLVYNATVAPQALTYESLSNSINPTAFSWEIQAVPVAVEGFRPTAHIIIDTRHMDQKKIDAIEAWLYGSDDEVAHIPSPQAIFDLLSFGDTIVVTDNGDGTFDVVGSYENVYMIDNGIFRVDNVDGQDNGDGTFTISTTIE